MDRVPEPELMDDPQQAAAYAAADFAAPHDHFIELLHDRCAPRQSGRALDLGCGNADVTLRFARRWPDWTVLGVDGSEAMLDLGRRAVAAEGRPITFQCTLLPSDSLPAGAFDLVFSNSLLHHLRDPGTLWSSVKGSLRPGGWVFVMDLARPPDRATAEALVELYSANEHPLLRRDFFHSLCAAYHPDEVRAQLEVAELTELTVEEVSDRHWIAYGLVGDAPEA